MVGLGRRVTSKSKQARSIRPVSRMSAKSSLRHGESLASQESPGSQATSAIDRATSRRHPISSGAKELSSKLSDSRSAPSVRRCQSTALRPRRPSVVPTRGGVSPGGPRPSGLGRGRRCPSSVPLAPPSGTQLFTKRGVLGSVGRLPDVDPLGIPSACVGIDSPYRGGYGFVSPPWQRGRRAGSWVCGDPPDRAGTESARVREGSAVQPERNASGCARGGCMGSRKSERGPFGGVAGSRVVGGSSVAIGRGTSRGAFRQPKRRLVS